MNDVFYWKEILLFQNKEVLKIGTDAILLGSWISHLSLSPRTILDVGCGTGILALMMASLFPNALIEAIDIDNEAVLLTNQNFLGSNWSSRLQARQENVLAMAQKVSTHDLVICNPPYYFNQLMPEDATRKNSRHTNHHMLNWMKSFTYRCNENGWIALIIPYHLASAWIHAGNEAGIYCQIRKNIYSFITDNVPIRSLLLFGKTLKPLVIDDIAIFEAKGRFTIPYTNFTAL